MIDPKEKDRVTELAKKKLVVMSAGSHFNTWGDVLMQNQETLDARLKLAEWERPIALPPAPMPHPIAGTVAAVAIGGAMVASAAKPTSRRGLFDMFRKAK